MTNTQTATATGPPTAIMDSVDLAGKPPTANITDTGLIDTALATATIGTGDGILTNNGLGVTAAIASTMTTATDHDQGDAQVPIAQTSAIMSALATTPTGISEVVDTVASGSTAPTTATAPALDVGYTLKANGNQTNAAPRASFPVRALGPPTGLGHIVPPTGYTGRLLG